MKTSDRWVLAQLKHTLVAEAGALAVLAADGGQWHTNRAFRTLCRRQGGQAAAALRLLLRRGGRHVRTHGRPLMLCAPARSARRSWTPMRWRLRFCGLRRRGQPLGVLCRLDLQTGWRGTPGVPSVLPWYLPAPRPIGRNGRTAAAPSPPSLRPDLRAVHPKDRAAILRALRRSLEQRQPFALDCRLRLPRGPYHWHRIAGRPEQNAGGTVLGWVGGSQDRQAECRASQSQRTFVRLASHELNTPLTSLMLNLQLALKRAKQPGLDGSHGRDSHQPSAKIAPALERALVQARKLRTTMHRLLEAQRGSAARPALRRRAEDVGAVVAGALSQATPALRAAGCVLHTHIEAALIYPLDTRCMLEAMAYLFDNVVKFAPGSQVTVEARRDAEQIVVAVRDDGPGIAEEAGPRVFHPFVRGDVHRSTSGMGVGLTLCRQIVRAHGGRLSLDTKPARGAHLVIGLPSPCPVPAETH